MLAGIWKTMRPHQWVKNLFVLAPLVFAKRLDDVPSASRAALGFLLFCLVSSAVYIINDLVDADFDRRHPIKQNRPIPSGVVSKTAAAITSGGFITTALALSLLLGWPFTGALVGYLLLNVSYSFLLKHVPYLDVLCIAVGFEFRVLAGTFAAQVTPTTYLLMVTLLLALFLGFGKRQHELAQGEAGLIQRYVLRHYSKQVVLWLLYATAAATLMTYFAYTFDEHTQRYFGTNQLPWSIPFAVFGVLRFLQLVRERADSESPTEDMLRDSPFMVNLVLWAIVVYTIIYV